MWAGRKLKRRFKCGGIDREFERNGCQEECVCVQLEAIAPEWGIGSQWLPHPKPVVSILVESTNCRLMAKNIRNTIAMSPRYTACQSLTD
jgi:hypothetical protein